MSTILENTKESVDTSPKESPKLEPVEVENEGWMTYPRMAAMAGFLLVCSAFYMSGRADMDLALDKSKEMASQGVSVMAAMKEAADRQLKAMQSKQQRF